MTALYLQKLCVSDCESTVQRSYFDWGRGSAKDSPEPDWNEASPEKRRLMTLRGYALYDGAPAQPGNVVGMTEAYISTGINSRVILNDVIRFLVRAERAAPLLARIPDEARLENATQDQLEAAGELIDLFAEAHMIGRGKATKVLYKKRPHFIPVIDSVVGDFLWKNFPFRIAQSSPTAEVLHLYRDLLLARSQPLSQIQTALNVKGLYLSTTRILSHLIWHEWYPYVDAYGFGRPLTEIWAVPSAAEARKTARFVWEECGGKMP